MGKLNLGCGEFAKEGYINVDYYSAVEPDVRHNLNVFPYPFDDNQFDLIEADHLLEHLDSPFNVMKELYRIAKPGGRIVIRVPHFSRGFTHAGHKRGFDISFPSYFDPQYKWGIQGVNLVLEKLRLRWFAQPYLKKTILPFPVYALGYLLGGAIDLLANISPWLCSRCWCFVVGGFEEIEMRFRVEK
jgi:SAM-dependent methyltransferase